MTEKLANEYINLDGYPDQIVELSAEGKIYSVSGNCFGELKFVPGNHIFEAFPADLRMRLKNSLEKCVVGKNIFTIELEVKSKFFEFRMLPRVPNVMMFVRDITAQTMAEQIIRSHYLQLIESGKQAALRQLAGGVAHEINNPLAIIMGKAEALSDKLEEEELEPDAMKESIETVKQMVGRISHIVNSLRNFACDVDPETLCTKKVQEIVGSALSICWERFRNFGITIDVKDLSAEMTIECRPNQIEQALLNLFINSFEAIKGLSERWIRVETMPIGEMIKIVVTDSGNGIDPQIAGLIMQPFFTTKDLGKGVGTGLSITKGIVEQHGGEINLNSRSINTSFELLLPRVQRKK